MNFKNKKIIANTLIILLILDIPFILYLFNFNSFAFNENFYKTEFQKHDVYSKLKDYDIEKVNKDVLDYLKHRDIELKNDFFSDREKEHMKDVKDLIQFILFVFYFSIVLFFILIFSLVLLVKNNKKLIKTVGRILLFGGLLTFIDAFIFFLLTKINFDFLFDSMHKIFFRAGTYVFDPSFEKIIILYPQQVFFDATVDIVVNTLFFSLAFVLAGFLMWKIQKTK